jgi:hypothetical protein
MGAASSVFLLMRFMDARKMFTIKRAYTCVLQEELWCHRYYLRNLCNEARFPGWHIRDHVQLLQVLCFKNAAFIICSD